MCVGLLTACGSDGGEEEPTDQESEEVDGRDAEKPSPEDLSTSATLHTSEGDIALTLFPEQAPETVANFTGLADGSVEWSDQQDNEPLYDGTIFHRVIDGFMIQGGDPEGTGRGGPGYQFGDEFDETLSFDEPYMLAMANSGPGTNGSQFFITVAPTQHLDGKHTIFGEIADEGSAEVVDAIATTETGVEDRPVEDVVIESITVD